MTKRIALAIFLLLSYTIPGRAAFADTPAYVLDSNEAGVALDQSIQSPAEFLGFEIGDRAIGHRETLLYFRYLAASSDRAEFAQYGSSPAGRELIRLVISEPGNLGRLVEVHRALEQMGDGSAAEVAGSDTIPAVAWMGYGIHGDELASSDAAVMVAYRLIAGEDEEMRALRRNLVVYVDPMYNPDGRSRATGHVDTFRRAMPSVDPQDMVHNQLWPNGRGNHYFFDLNRDALYQVQTQSRQRVSAIRAASPQLYVASHETEWSDTYLFAVPAEPFNPFLPKEVHESWADFSTDHSAAFDERALNYYTRAWNEVFFPGYYDVWPAYFGAVPILYEQSATSGLSIRIPTAQTVTFRDAVSNHYRSSMANLLTAARMKDTLLARWAAARRDAARPGGASKTWLILPQDRYKISETLRVFLSLGIAVDELASPVSARGLHDYWGASDLGLTLPAGTLRVVTSQLMGRLVHNLLDYHVPMSRDFLQQEKLNLDLGHDTQIYDVTAWSLPLAYNLPAYWSAADVRGDWRPLQESPEESGAEPVAPANYGYLYLDDSLHATARLLGQGIKVRVGNLPFMHEGVAYPEGTFLVRGREQAGDVRAALDRELAAGAIRVRPAGSARIVEGGPDLGGDDFTLLEEPRIAVLGGNGVSVTSFGAIWHLFDETIRIPLTLIDVARLEDVDLAEYSVLVLPEADADSEVLSRLLEGGALGRWIESGGTLVAVGESSLLLSRSGLISAKVRGDLLEAYPPYLVGRSAAEWISNDFAGLPGEAPQSRRVLPPVVSAAARRFLGDDLEPFEVEGNVATFADWSENLNLPDEDKKRLLSGLHKYLPHGAYLRAELKPRHWLGYGIGDKVPALFRDTDVLVPGESSELVGRYAAPADLMMSGLVWPEAVGYIAGTAYLVREKRGRGQVIAFANDPTFRGYSLGTSRLFLNAVILSGGYR